MAGNGSKEKVSLKIVVDMKAKKVVFAEAGHQFVDFIFQILSLPLSTVTKLLTDNNMKVGSLGNLYKSVEVLISQCFKRNVDKDTVLQLTSIVNVPLLLVCDSRIPPTAIKVYRCSSHLLISDSPDMYCCLCRKRFVEMKSFTFVPKASSLSYGTQVGFVNDGMTYLVLDNLEVMPMSFTYIKSLVNELDSLEEIEVEVGLLEGLAILKASLESNSVLTAVFLHKVVARTNPYSQCRKSRRV